MANSYRLKISPSGITGTVLGQELSLRELDLAILENLFAAAANTFKDARSIHLCVDFMKSIKNIKIASGDKDEKTEIILDDMDKTNLEKGIEATANNRPLAWFESGLWTQFDKLEPIKREV